MADPVYRGSTFDWCFAWASKTNIFICFIFYEKGLTYFFFRAWFINTIYFQIWKIERKKYAGLKEWKIFGLFKGLRIDRSLKKYGISVIFITWGLSELIIYWNIGFFLWENIEQALLWKIFFGRCFAVSKIPYSWINYNRKFWMVFYQTSIFNDRKIKKFPAEKL